jgi:hypothetical protein
VFLLVLASFAIITLVSWAAQLTKRSAVSQISLYFVHIAVLFTSFDNLSFSAWLQLLNFQIVQASNSGNQCVAKLSPTDNVILSK